MLAVVRLKTVGAAIIALAVVAIVVWAWRRTSSPGAASVVVQPDAGARPEAVLSVGQTVVMNALGVGEVKEFSVLAMRDGVSRWGYVVKVRSYDAFVPADKVPGLLWPICDRAMAESMLEAILHPDEASEPPPPEARKTRMLALWASGTHLEQAQLLGQVLRASSVGDSAIVIGTGHVLREISFVLGIPIRELDARIDARFPKWRAHLPERDPDDR